MMTEDTVAAVVFDQLDGLLQAIHSQESHDEAARLLRTFLGDTGSRAVTDRPHWPSDVADDHSPVEWSVAFQEHAPPTARILVEPIAGTPNHRDNTDLALRQLGSLTGHSGLTTGRLRTVSDLFFPRQPDGLFSIWYSLVLKRSRPAEIKAYLNPAAQRSRTPVEVVETALRRLGFGDGFPVVARHGLRRGAELDGCPYFALDLSDHDETRVKLYLSHAACDVEDLVRAARAVPDLDIEQLRDFCDLAGDGQRVFARRPPMSSYSFVGSGTRPEGFSLYLPLRDYVTDDQEARDRTISVLKHFGMDANACDDTIAAVAGRELGAGRGLISHLSLRMGSPRPGVSVYLSTELYGALPRLDPADR